MVKQGVEQHGCIQKAHAVQADEGLPATNLISFAVFLLLLQGMLRCSLARSEQFHYLNVDATPGAEWKHQASLMRLTGLGDFCNQEHPA